MIAVSAYVAKLWFDDYRASRSENPNPRALPGATKAPAGALVLGAAVILLLLALETWGEMHLGLTEQQTKMTALFAVYTLCAAVVEEIVFRGFIVWDKGSQTMLWASVFGASLLFAALHPYLWEWKEGKLLGIFTPKGWFSTGSIFVGSLWFYVCRFAGFNPKRSLLPCFAAHGAKNLGVILIKATQGFLVGWF